MYRARRITRVASRSGTSFNTPSWIGPAPVQLNGSSLEVVSGVTQAALNSNSSHEG